MMASDAMTLVGVIQRRWTHSDPVDSEYIDELASVHADHAFAAVDSWYRDGERFAPSAGQIIGRIADLALDMPDWYVVVNELHHRQSAAGKQSWTNDRICPHGRCDGRGLVIDEEARTSSYCECREQLQAEIAARQTTHPVVAQFIAEIGQREIADVLLGDRTAEAQVRNKYEAFARNARRSIAYTGIDTAGLPALERLQQERERRIEIEAARGQAGLRQVRTLDSGDVAA